MPDSTSKPIALVTGGAKRVGAAIVRELVRAGFEVAFTYNRSASHAAALVSSLDGKARSVQCDLAEPGSVDSIVGAIDAGRVSLVVNSASIYVPDSALDDAKSERMRRVNLDVPVAIVKRLAPSLRSNAGCVVNMVDILAERPMPTYSVYCSTKAALWNATLAMARQLAPSARAVGIAPGVVDWPDDMPQAERERYLSRVPLARAGTPEDVAQLVRFLACEGTYITGQVIRLDGGRSIL